jgi:hypothetical protein
MGGYAGEDLAMGRARGGFTLEVSYMGLAVEQIERLSEGRVIFQHKPMLFARQVDSRMELFAGYRKDRNALHIEDPVEADIYVDLWSDSPETDGYVYGRVLEAVDGSRYLP